MKRYLKKTTLIAIFILFGITVVNAGGKKLGEAVVKVKANANVTAIAAELQLIVSDSITTNRTFLMKFSKNRSVDKVVAQLNSYNDVELASFNSSIDIPEVFQISQGFPDESEPILNKSVSPVDFYGQAGSYDLGIDDAQLIATGKNVVIAVIDNGIDYSHPLMISSTVLPGHDFILNTSNPSEQAGSIYGHGTFVTGLLLLTAPDASIMPLRAFDGEGVGDQFNVAKAIDWAVKHGADIINMSFGTTELIDVLQSAIDDATLNNVVMIAATGNESSDLPYFPAAHPDVIAVAAIDTLELLAGFSNYGDYVDVVAPGVNMYSSLAGEFNWGTWSGTSFSAPIVSGTVAMMKQIESNYTPADFKEHLKNTTRTELLWGNVIIPDVQYGYGMINSYNAVSQLSIGDLNGDGVRDIRDLTMMIDYITNRNNNGGGNNSESIERQGNIVTDALVDLDCDGDAKPSDIAIMVHHIFVKWREFKPCYKSGDATK